MPAASGKGLMIKNIAIVGAGNGLNGEYWWNGVTFKDKRSIVHPDPSGVVEYDRTDRIIQQIKQIIQLAREHHDEGKLTRVVTDEFSFYPKGSPLSLEEYKKIINETSIALKNLPANISLVFSSMPVMWSDGKVRNAILHAQSPNYSEEDPVLHHFSKESCSLTDPLYAKAGDEHDCYEYSADVEAGEHAPSAVLKDTPIRCDDPYQYKSAILVEGMGIPPLIEAIDVCLDHQNGVAMRNAAYLINGLMPSQSVLHISHIITSNHIKAVPEKLVASEVHVDWRKVQVVEKKETKSLDNAFFGSLADVYIYEDRKAEICYGELLDRALVKMNDPAWTERRFPPDGNTLLHEVLLQEKGGHVQENFRLSRVKRILREFTSESINQLNRNSDTPLHLALQIYDDVSLLTEFLERGAKLGIKNKQGKTPIRLACEVDEFGVKCIQHLLTKLINSGRVYFANREEIFTILDEVYSIPELSAQHPLLVKSAFAFELHEVTPSPERLLKLLTYLPEELHPAYQVLIIDRMKQHYVEALQAEEFQGQDIEPEKELLLLKINKMSRLGELKRIPTYISALKEVALASIKQAEIEREELHIDFQEKLDRVKEKFTSYEAFSSCLNANPIYQELSQNHVTYSNSLLKARFDECLGWFEQQLKEDKGVAPRTSFRS